MMEERKLQAAQWNYRVNLDKRVPKPSSSALLLVALG
jgi:hypothetical protein